MSRKRSLSPESSDSPEDDMPTKTAKTAEVSSGPAGHYTCSLPPTCSLSNPSIFPTLSALESHYTCHHAYTCSFETCSKVFPDERFLNLHLDECHNPLMQLKRERGDKIYRCFELLVCDRSFSTPKNRRRHLVEVHKYPKEFYFSLPLNGLNELYSKYGEAVSLIRPAWKPRTQSTTGAVDLDAEDSSPASDVPSISSRMTAHDPIQDETVNALAQRLQDGNIFASSSPPSLVPKQIRFGARRGRGR